MDGRGLPVARIGGLTIRVSSIGSMLPATILVGFLLADAVSVLRAGARAVVRRLAPVAPPWQIVATTMIARGRLLTPPMPSG